MPIESQSAITVCSGLLYTLVVFVLTSKHLVQSECRHGIS